jgi:hypothetical protein
MIRNRPVARPRQSGTGRFSIPHKAMRRVKRAPKRRAWPAEKIELWTLDRIKPYGKNPRTHSEDQVELIAKNMQRFGVTTPVLVDQDGVLIYGHGRLLAAQKLKFKTLPVCVAPADWSEADKKAYRVADNQLGLLSMWDVPNLKGELGELDAVNFDLQMLGFGAAELKAWTMPELVDPLAEWRDMPEFIQASAQAFRTIVVHFKDENAVQAFAALVQQAIGPKTRFIWFPPEKNASQKDQAYESTVPGLRRDKRPVRHSANDQDA